MQKVLYLLISLIFFPFMFVIKPEQLIAQCPETQILFSIPEPGHVVLEIFNTRGQIIITWLDNQISAGIHSATWDASKFASGIYYYRLRSQHNADMKKMISVK